MSHKATLYKAPFVVPVDQPPIENGAVLVSKGGIIQVGSFADLQDNVSSEQVVDLDGRVITPALINCHAHLELSWMEDMGKDDGYFVKGDITDWINSLLIKREAGGVTDQLIEKSAQTALASLHDSGVAIVADIGNDEASGNIGQGQQPDVLFFLEIMGLTKKSAQLMEMKLPALEDFSCTAHGPYSVHPELIQTLKQIARTKNQLFPIHTAESEDEMEFLLTGKGRFNEFLGRRLQKAGLLDGDFSDVFTAPECGAITFLERLNVLDERTICIHAVHVSEGETAILADRQAKVCLCPASNRFLGIGKAPVRQFLRHGILPGLGTDSLASNDQLSIWNEMRILQQDHPDLAPELIFSMATMGGAKTLAADNGLGSITAGKKSKLLAVSYDGQTSDELYETLVNSGEPAHIQWLEG